MSNRLDELMQQSQRGLLLVPRVVHNGAWWFTSPSGKPVLEMSVRDIVTAVNANDGIAPNFIYFWTKNHHQRGFYHRQLGLNPSKSVMLTSKSLRGIINPTIFKCGGWLRSDAFRGVSLDETEHILVSIQAIVYEIGESDFYSYG